MAQKIYIAWGILICALFLYNTARGAEFFGSTTGSKPTGGAAHYHK